MRTSLACACVLSLASAGCPAGDDSSGETDGSTGTPPATNTGAMTTTPMMTTTTGGVDDGDGSSSTGEPPPGTDSTGMPGTDSTGEPPSSSSDDGSTTAVVESSSSSGGESESSTGEMLHQACTDGCTVEFTCSARWTSVQECADWCEANLDKAGAFSPFCEMAWEALSACFGTLSCKEYTQYQEAAKFPYPCWQQADALAFECEGQ